MLYLYRAKSLELCRLAGFSNRSIQALEIRVGESRSFASTLLAPGSLHGKIQ
jgi:hypothetical protein